MLLRWLRWVSDAAGYHDGRARLWVLVAPALLILAMLLLWLA